MRVHWYAVPDHCHRDLSLGSCAYTCASVAVLWMTESFGLLTVAGELLAFADEVAEVNVDAAKIAARASSRVLDLRLIGGLARSMKNLSLLLRAQPYVTSRWDSVPPVVADMK